MSEAAWYRQLAPLLLAAAFIPLARSPTGPIGAAPSPALNEAIGAMLPCSVAAGRLPPPRLVELTSADGSLRGYRLRLGTVRRSGGSTIDLPAESFIEPVGRAVLVGSDNGRTSRLRLVGAASDCQTTLVTTTRIVRRATVDPDGRWLVALQLERESRRDLGVYRRPLRGERWTRLLPPIEVDAPAATDRIGTIYSTMFAWSSDGSALAVQSCGAIECATRVLDGGRRLLLAARGQGPLVELTDLALATEAACPGRPCPTLRTPLSDGEVLR